jgi:beta-galactosidase
MIRFEVQGAGRIIGVANGDPSCHEADVHLDGNYSRSLFNGKCQVLIQSDNHEGMIIVRASAEGIEPASVSISASRSPGRPSVGIIW